MKIKFKLLFLLFVVSSYGQVTNYSFTASLGTYTPITGTQIITPSTDDGNSSLTNIGFNFVFNGTTLHNSFINQNMIV